jgi:hypothetical protein
MSAQPEHFGRSRVISFEGLLSHSTESGGCAPPRTCLSSDEPTRDETHALNTLIVGLLDHIDEHRRAIFATEQRLNRMQQQLYSRVQAVERLQTYVRSLGVQPASTCSTLAAAIAAKLAAQPHLKSNEQELIEDAERGERNLRRQIDECLARGAISEAGQRCISEVLTELNFETNKAAGWNAQTLLSGKSLCRTRLSRRGFD